MSEKKLCRKCGEREVANDNCPYCAYCWNHLDLSDPKERNAYSYYGNKMFWAQHPEAWEKEKQRRIEYNENHKEQIKESKKKYLANNREKWNAYQRQYQKRKREEIKAKLARLAELEKQIAVDKSSI